MAHGLKDAQTLRMHQALHGYADGHRQLALSAALKPRDQKTLLALSDISGPGARLEENGYLTGYPLADSGFFALARTWPAPEMARPGCVWTHTLLIDFADLAALDTLTSLPDLFRRPFGADDTQDYGKPKYFDIQSRPAPPAFTESWVRRVTAALYGKPRSCIVATHVGSEVDLAVLALWSQQWPRLRRGFRFCTFAASDRSVEGATFDLQVLPSAERGLRSRFADMVDAESIGPRAYTWLEDALLDLAKPDKEGLRTFFRQLGSDLAGGRELFRPLCRLHRLVRAFAERPEAVREAIAVLQDELGTKQARTARTLVVKAALKEVDTLDNLSFDFLWSSLDLIEPEALAAVAARLGRSAWRRDPARLSELAESDGEKKIVVERALAELELGELIGGLRQVPELLGAALTARPELVGQSAFWSSLKAVDVPFRAAGSSGLQLAAVSAIVKAGRSDLAFRAVGEFGTKTVLQSLKISQDVTSDRLRTWIQAGANDTAGVAEFLATEPGIPQAMLHALARVLPPDAVPNDYGSDPWLNAWRSSSGGIDETSKSYLAAYLMSRALGSRTRSPGELAQLSFETVHAAAASDRLSDEGWRFLEPRLPWSAFWFVWDRCQRMQAGVVDLFLDHDLPPVLFASLAQDDHLFLMLAAAVARNSRGRRYLKRVHRAMKDKGTATASARIRAVEKLLA